MNSPLDVFFVNQLIFSFFVLLFHTSLYRQIYPCLLREYSGSFNFIKIRLLSDNFMPIQKSKP